MAVAAIVKHAGDCGEVATPTPAGSGELAGFRRQFYGCLRTRTDALFELAEAVLCTDGPVRSLVGLSREWPPARGFHVVGRRRLP